MALETFNTAYTATVEHIAANALWATIIAGAGNAVTTGLYATVHCDGDANKYLRCQRAVFVFDTSSLSAGSEDAAVTLTGSLVDTYATTPAVELGLYAASPVDPESIAAGDYANCGSVLCSDTTITASAWKNSGHNMMPLNSFGLSQISTSGYTVFSLREVAYDIGATSPPWEADKRAGFEVEVAVSAHLRVNLADTVGADRTLNEPIVTLQAMRQIEMQFGGQLSISKDGKYRYKSRTGYYT